VPPAGLAAQVCAALFRSRQRAWRAATAEKKWSILGTVVAVLLIGRSFLFARDGEDAAEGVILACYT
jgi:hypothetical protein